MRQVWLEFERPSDDLGILMSEAKRRGAVVISRKRKPALLVMSADVAKSVLNHLLARDGLSENTHLTVKKLLPFEKVLGKFLRSQYSQHAHKQVFQKLPYCVMGSGPGRRAKPKRFPGFSKIQDAFLIISSVPISSGELVLAEEVRQRLVSHVDGWPAQIGKNLLKLFDEYIALVFGGDRQQASHAWNNICGYISNLLEYVVIDSTRRRARDVPIVHVYGHAWADKKKTKG